MILPFPLVALLIIGGANGLAYLFIYLDKRRAERGSWRIKEGTLLLPVVFGGGIAAYFAMKKYRHKTRKMSFRVAFWACAFLSVVGWGLIFFQRSL